MGLGNISLKGIDLLGFNKFKSKNQSDLNFPYDEGYITSSDVYAVTSKIAKGGKSIPWILKSNTNGNIETVLDGELYRLVNNPNEHQTRAEFVEMALLFLLLSGENFQKSSIPLGFTQVGKVELLYPQLMTVETKQIGFNYIVHNYRYASVREPIEKDSITHLKYANPTEEGYRSLRGLSPLVAGYLTLVGLNNNQKANASILENQGAAGILSNESERSLTDPERVQAQGALDKLISGVRNFGKVIQSGTKVKFTRLGLDPTQLKIIESKLLKFRDLCAIYDVKSILFNDPINASFNNLTNAEKSFWINAAIPNTELIIKMFSDGVISKFNTPSKKYFIELDISGISVLQADLKKEAEKDKVKMEGINVVLNMPISSNAKIQLLVNEYEYTEEAAQIMINPEGQKNKSLEILRSLSPLLANKIIEKMTDEDVLNLLK